MTDHLFGEHLGVDNDKVVETSLRVFDWFTNAEDADCGCDLIKKIMEESEGMTLAEIVALSLRMGGAVGDLMSSQGGDDEE